MLLNPYKKVVFDPVCTLKEKSLCKHSIRGEVVGYSEKVVEGGKWWVYLTPSLSLFNP